MMELDDETREQLGRRNPWPNMLVLLVLFREKKRLRDRTEKANARESRVVKAAEAKQQREYAHTEGGKEARRRAAQKYRATDEAKKKELEAQRIRRARKAS